MRGLSDEALERALATTCRLCGAAPGLECVNPITGVPVMDTFGDFPVHLYRIDGD